ncbi:MAG: acyltransferase [Candidatus Devosia phytovorans]|uniref:Acyltransferase n=1 Tax=Candidatus Devosia phytovorans TaxID=3121372 RepID=A0AAJ5VU51_9HYPH|nr:acyltransferase [Devosia sp.]WEK03647.1 MAG: acyltransferase [Devosia sp.]
MSAIASGIAIEPTRTLYRHALIGTPGYSAPQLADARWFSFAEIAAGAVDNLALQSDAWDENNIVVLEAGAVLTRPLRIHTKPRTRGAIVVLGRDLTLCGDLRLMGTDQTVVLTGGIAEVGHSGQMSAQIWGSGAALFVGAKSTTNGATFVLSGDQRHIFIGDDAMFANGIHISTHDEHAVMDIASRQRVNLPGSVLVEPHVWLGRNTTVGKNVSIGLGSVVGAHSLVTRSCPRFSVIGGAPAKLIRTGSTWDRYASGRPETVDRVLALSETVAAPPPDFFD